MFVSVLGILVVRNYVLDLQELPEWQYGPVSLNPFGVLVAVDFFFGYYLVRRWCKRFHLRWDALENSLPVLVLIAAYISHLIAVLLYQPDNRDNWSLLLNPWSGLSAFGGMFGGALVSAVYLRYKRLPFWLYHDAIAYGFVGGFIFGRLGCFAAHDHPGVPTEFVLGVHVLGAIRHDLGLYLMLVMVALFGAVTWMARRGHPAAGSVTALICTVYPFIRFYLDGLRINEVTYGGWTPGQWLCFPTLAFGLWALSVACKPSSATARHGAPQE